MSSFGPDALRRYHEWCGASPQEAILALGEAKDLPARWLPEVDGERSTPAQFASMLDGFFTHHDLGEEWRGDGLVRDFHDPAPVLPSLEGETGSVVIGLTGVRGSGKSVIGDHLFAERSFIKVHPFNPGKALLRGYYVSRGASEEQAWNMTDGSLKDTPSEHLPFREGEHASSRWVMENLGRYMARDMGLGYTIGAEMGRLMKADGDVRLLIESCVYEENEIRKMGNSLIVKLDVPDEARISTNSAGKVSDSYVDGITPDFVVINDMSGKQAFIDKFNRAALEAGFDYGQERDNSPSP